MRSFLTPTAFLFSVLAFGQSGPCEPFDFCFVPNQLPSGNYFFDNCSSGPATTQYIWSYGDGTSSASIHGEHGYAAPGTYSVCLTAYWGNCSDSTCTTITVGAGNPCDSGFDVELAWNAGQNGNVFFTATSNIPGTNFIWYFADGSEGYGDAVVHPYAEGGTYDVCVSGWYFNEATQDTCWTEDCEQITVPNSEPCEGLEACFAASQLSSSGFFFDNCSTPALNSTFVWLFGDGTTTTELAPIHTFAEPGVYTVCLVVNWPNGCVSEDCQVLAVGVDPCAGLNACFVTNYLQQPGRLFFDNCTNGQGNEQFVWNFGDGTSSTVTNAEHTYTQNGTYTVCLTAYEGNCSDSTCTTIIVDDLGGDICDELDACFEALPFENGAYYFENCSELLPIDIPAYYLWNFGDGSTSNQAQPDHAFLPGTYTVCLTVTHGNCMDSTCTTITVLAGPGCDPNYAVEFSWVDQGTAVIYTATSNLNTVGYNWSFGDGAVGYGQTITHLYEPPGPYEVCVDAWYWNDIQQDTCWARHCELVDPFDTGLGELGGSRINVFPVPTTELLTITGLTANTPLRLFAADGRIVYNGFATGGTQSIDVADLAKGSYILRIAAAHGNLHRKVTVE